MRSIEEESGERKGKFRCCATGKLPDNCDVYSRCIFNLERWEHIAPFIVKLVDT